MRKYKRPDSPNWYVEFYRGKSKSLGTSDKKEAEAIFKELKRQWLRGRLIQLDPAKQITLNDFKKEYLSRDYNSTKTYKADELALRLLADSIGGTTLLRSITPRKIEKFKKDCALRKCKPTTIRTYLRHIKAALGVAEDWYSGYKRPKIKIGSDKLKPQPLSPDEIKRLLKEADTRLKPIVIFALWTGARRNEIVRLQWQDIQFGKNPQAMLTGKGGKTRAVPLLPRVRKILKRRQQDIGPVFEQVHPDTITHWFRNLARSCQIQARFHDLRHSAATYMLASGTPLAVVQKILGHEDISTTMIYTEVLEEMIQKEMKLRFE